MEEIYKKNKFKNFINKSKEALEKTKNNIFNVFLNTKEKIKNTINKLSEKIKKVQKEINDELNEVLAKGTDQGQNNTEQKQQEDTRQGKQKDKDEEDKAVKSDKDYKDEDSEEINEEKIEQGIGNNLKELLKGYFSMLEHSGKIDYLISNNNYYNETLHELIKFSETKFMEETVWMISDNGQFKEYCSAHLRNLLTPFKTIISLIENLSTGKINEDKFKSFMDNLSTNLEDNKKEFLEFCDFLNDKDTENGGVGNSEIIKDNDNSKSNNNIDIDFFEGNLDNNTKQIIIKQILEKESKKDYYARGSEGIIFKIEIEDEKGEKKEYLVAKKRFDHNTHKEINLHKEVQSLMPVGNDLVRIPELKAEIGWLNGENYIIMDFIKGKTIYQKTMEEILHKKGLGEFNFVNDNEATTYFCKFLGIEKNTDDNLNKVDQEYSRLSKDIKIFDSKTGKEYATAIKKFIDTMHKNGIYHRDIHPKNIIIGDDGKLYIIDFGKSIKVDPEKNISEKEIYTEQVGEMTGEYVRDESGVSMIKGLTKSEEDEDNEQRVKKHIEKEKNLTKKINSGDSVIKHFTELPKGFKIKMERKQFLKEVEKESKISKRISLDTFLDSKGDEQIIYLFTQSLENIENILQEIETQTKVCENKINKGNSDYRAEQPLFRKEHITPYEKKLKGMSTLKKKLEKIKQAIE